MTSPVLYIDGWSVDPACQGRGIGWGLMDATLTWPEGEVAADAGPVSKGSIKAHHALGFSDGP